MSNLLFYWRQEVGRVTRINSLLRNTLLMPNESGVGIRAHGPEKIIPWFPSRNQQWVGGRPAKEVPLDLRPSVNLNKSVDVLNAPPAALEWPWSVIKKCLLFCNGIWNCLLRYNLQSALLRKKKRFFLLFFFFSQDHQNYVSLKPVKYHKELKKKKVSCLRNMLSSVL